MHYSIDRFQNNSAIKGREDHFILADALVAPVLASWRLSLFSHEWLHQDGSIRKPADMNDKMRVKRKEIEELLDSTSSFERPVLGIGILDTVEIGAGRDLFLSLAARGIEKIPVHVPKGHADDFRLFVRFS